MTDFQALIEQQNAGQIDEHPQAGGRRVGPSVDRAPFIENKHDNGEQDEADGLHVKQCGMRAYAFARPGRHKIRGSKTQ
jgi:hypothetical protein